MFYNAHFFGDVRFFVHFYVKYVKLFAYMKIFLYLCRGI
jgi:hypothetical protein